MIEIAVKYGYTGNQPSDILSENYMIYGVILRRNEWQWKK